MPCARPASLSTPTWLGFGVRLRRRLRARAGARARARARFRARVRVRVRVNRVRVFHADVFRSFTIGSTKASPLADAPSGAAGRKRGDTFSPMVDHSRMHSGCVAASCDSRRALSSNVCSCSVSAAASS